MSDLLGERFAKKPAKTPAVDAAGAPAAAADGEHFRLGPTEPGGKYFQWGVA
jgi:hypothetical protein